MSEKGFLKSFFGKFVIVFATVFIVAAAVFFWHQQAGKKLAALSAEWFQAFSEINALETKVVDSSGRPKSEIAYEDLVQLKERFEAQKGRLDDIRGRIAAGEGMAFWVPKRRALEAESQQDRIDKTWVFVKDAQSALQAVSGPRAKYLENTKNVADERAQAVRVLREDAEIAEFEASARDLLVARGKVVAAVEYLDRERTSGRLSGIPENLRAALLGRMQSELRDQRNLLDGRIAASREAQKLLVEKMSQVNGLIANSTGFLFQIAWIAEQLQPASEKVYELTQPISDLLKKADQPIAGDFGNFVGRFLQKDHNDRLSPLSLACQLDPNVKSTVEIIAATCQAIETIRNEISGVISAARPVTEGVESFRSDRSRKTMLVLAGAASRANSYFLSKIKIFDPVLSKIEEGHGQIEKIYQIARRIQIPQVRQMINLLAEKSGEVFSFAESPFRRGHQIIAGLADDLNNIPALEKSYRESLSRLADKSYIGKPEEVPAASISQETSGEKDLISSEEKPAEKKAIDENKPDISAFDLEGVWIPVYDPGYEIEIKALNSTDFKATYIRNNNNYFEGKIILDRTPENVIVKQYYSEGGRLYGTYQFTVKSSTFLSGTLSDYAGGPYPSEWKKK